MPDSYPRHAAGRASLAASSRSGRLRARPSRSRRKADMPANRVHGGTAAVSITERPMIMTGHSVKAIFAGCKTKTRRGIEPAPEGGEEADYVRIHGPMAFPVASKYGNQSGMPLLIDGTMNSVHGIRNRYPV